MIDFTNIVWVTLNGKHIGIIRRSFLDEYEFFRLGNTDPLMVDKDLNRLKTRIENYIE